MVMSRAHPRSIWTRVAALFVALAAAAQPALGASSRQSPSGASGVEDGRPSCCVPGAECCGAEEGGTREPSYVPSCCGLGELPSRPPEPDQAPRLSVPDPMRRALAQLTRGYTVPTLAPTIHADLLRRVDPANLRGPPASASALHWWTSRGAPAA